MARAKPEPVTEVDLSEQFGDMFTAAELSPALDKLRAEAGLEGDIQCTVYIYKLREGAKDARVWEGSPSDYDLMNIARQHGSGDYRMRLYMPTDRGNPGQKANWVESIQLSPAEDARIIAVRKGEVPVGPINQQQPADFAAIIARAVAEGVKAAIPVVPAAPVDIFANMEKMAIIMRSLMPQQNAGGGMQETLAVLKTAFDITNGMRGGNDDSGGERGVKDVAMLKGLNIVEKMFERHLTQSPASGAVVLPNAVAKQPELTAEEIAEVEEMKMALRFLLRKAMANVPADQVAESVYEDVPDAMIFELYNNPQWFEVLCQNEPRFTQHKEWCAALRGKLIAFAQEDGLLTADGKLAQPIEHGASDAGNAPGPTPGTPIK